MQKSLEKVEISVTALSSQLGAALCLLVHDLSDIKFDALIHVKLSVCSHKEEKSWHTNFQKSPPPLTPPRKKKQQNKYTKTKQKKMPLDFFSSNICFWGWKYPFEEQDGAQKQNKHKKNKDMDTL